MKQDVDALSVPLVVCWHGVEDGAQERLGIVECKVMCDSLVTGSLVNVRKAGAQRQHTQAKDRSRSQHKLDSHCC